MLDLFTSYNDSSLFSGLKKMVKFHGGLPWVLSKYYKNYIYNKVSAVVEFSGIVAIIPTILSDLSFLSVSDICIYTKKRRKRVQ